MGPIRLAPDSPVLREHRVPAPLRTDEYVREFDSTTLCYDVFRNRRGMVTLVCPCLWNLWPVLRDGLFDESKPLSGRLRRRTFHLCEVLTLPRPLPRGALEFRHPDGRVQPVSIRESSGFFDGANCLLTMLRDEPVEWIVDWIRYHRHHHRADAVLIFNNRSTIYNSEMLLGLVGPASGISRLKVIDADFPHGRDRPIGRPGNAKWLQPATYNIARLSRLSHARAVLSVDVDELVRPVENSTIFDETVRTLGGLITFPGEWVFTKQPGKPQAQKEHGHIGVHPNPSPQKWCAVPAKPLGRPSWGVHHCGGVLYPLSKSRRFGFWHCRATSRNWKWDRFDNFPETRECADLVNATSFLRPGKG